MHYLVCLMIALMMTATAWAGGSNSYASAEPVAVGAQQPDEEDEEEQQSNYGRYDGIDISDHQKRIDWAEVARDKRVQYVYIKATEGATYVSNLYRYNLEQARKHGIKVGSYHFLRTGSRINDQFENFKRVVKKSEQDLLPLIDVEVRQGWTNQQLRDSVKRFADLVEEHYGCRPMIYTSSSFYDNILGRAFNVYPLFIARYSNTEPTLKSGNDWIMWQYSERGRVRGIPTNVDLSRFNKGRSLSDIMIRGHKIKQKRRSGSDLVDKNQEKPNSVKVKEAPTMSKQQEKELKRKQEKERKARERAQKLAQEEAKKKAEQERKQKEKERKLKEKQQKQNAKEQEHQRELQKRAEQQKKEQQEKAAKLQQEKEEQAAKEMKRQQELQARAQKNQQQAAQQQSDQQKKKQEQRSKLQQQKQQSQTQNLPTRTRANAHSSSQKNKKTNKSSADNE